MNYLSLSGIIIFLTSIACSGIVFYSKPKTTLKIIWGLFSLAVSFWGLGLFKAYITDDYIHALFWARFLNLSALTIPIFFIHFVFLFTKKFQEKGGELITYYAFVGMIFLFALLFPKEFIPNLSPKSGYQFYPNPGRIYYIFPLLFGYLTSYGSYLLYLETKSKNKTRSYQSKYILFGVTVGFIGGGTTFLEVFDLGIYPFGASFVTLYVILTTYAIIKYQLMDIRLAITRAGIFVFVYTLVLGIPFGVGMKYLGSGLWLMPVSLMAVFATIGPFIYLYIQKRAEEALLQEQRQYQVTLQQASLGMGQIKELKRLLNLVVHIITKTVSVEHSEVYLLHEDSKQYTLKASRGWRFSGKEQLSVLSFDSLLVRYLKENRESVLCEEIEHYAQDNEIKRFKEIEETIKQLEGALIVPSFMDQKMIAILVLGNKKSRKLYTQDDLAVFTILANHAGLAIENAQFYEKMKETHVQLLKAEKMATVGTLADGLSHQINNRLHAMGFIAGDALDTIKLRKEKKLTKDMKAFLDEIEHSFGRIEDNVKRGGEIVEGLLKYTRKGSEGFEAISFDKLLDSAIEMAQFKIKLTQINISRNFNGNIPDIKGNFTQLQEVFFNIIDNAYDAMMQRKEELKETEYKPDLAFSALRKGGKLEILVRDNGIGVAPENLEKLFTPFFTTKLSSKKGTGLGLYVIRQIIEENHGGKVKFTSKYKKGSQTSILLPVVIEDRKE